MPEVSDLERARILAEAEAGATIVMEQELRNASPDNVKMLVREAGRVESAIRYATWRIAAYEKDQCQSPW